VQPDHERATAAWRHIADQLRARWPNLGDLMDDAEADGEAPSRSGGSAPAERLHGLPRAPSHKAALDEPTRAPEQGGEAPCRRRGHLPKRSHDHAPRRRRAPRAERRLAAPASLHADRGRSRTPNHTANHTKSRPIRCTKANPEIIPR
jgi:hypothetical protein